MEPVTTETFRAVHDNSAIRGLARGYRLKTQFKHLLPPVHNRPNNYYLTPYCLPTYDPQYKLAMNDLSLTKNDDRSYFGAFNDKIHSQ